MVLHTHKAATKLNKFVPFEQMLGPLLIELDSQADSRGSSVKIKIPDFFLKVPSEVSLFLVQNPFAHTIRGMHFQISPYTEQKILTCVRGSIFDVLIDTRRNSRTFGKWTSVSLSDKGARALYIPSGIAHGYQTLEADTYLIYEMHGYYSPAHAIVINPFDTHLEIKWPEACKVISQRDENSIGWNDYLTKFRD